MPETRRNNLEVMRDEMIVRDKIRELLSAGPQTIPDLAGALDAPTSEVLVWLMAMRRYGVVEEVGRADANGYFKYSLAKEGER
jgi:hypothetical protein